MVSRDTVLQNTAQTYETLSVISGYSKITVPLGFCSSFVFVDVPSLKCCFSVCQWPFQAHRHSPKETYHAKLL